MMASPRRCWIGYCLSIFFCSLFFKVGAFTTLIGILLCTYPLMYTLVFSNSLKIADSDREVRVQLHEYYNPKNLEYVSDMTDTPYCCCNSDECASSIDSFTIMHCQTQCLLRVTVCLQREAGRDWTSSTSKKCYESRTVSTPPIYSFVMNAEDSSFFPNFTEIASEVVFNLDQFTSVSLRDNFTKK